MSPNTFTIPENIRNSLHAAGLSLLSTTTPEAASWWCELKRPAGEIERCMEWLAPDERARVDRLGTNLLRERYIAGRAMLRLLLGHILGVEPADVPLQRGARGRPQIGGPHSIDFNVSHTDDVALIGIARTTPECLRIGVDVERADRNVNADRLARKCLTSREANAQARLTPDERRKRFLRYWTCKEAMSKATGDGLMAPFGRLDVELGDPPRLITGPPPYVAQDWRLQAVDVPDGYLATLALWRPPNPSDAR